MELHPQARAFLNLVEEAGLPPLNELPPPQAREQARTAIELDGPGPALQTVEDFTIPTRGDQIAARRYEDGECEGTILWIHGGGWVICDLDTHDGMCRRLAQQSHCRVIAIDYRLAPEHPFPAPLEDCWDALQWVAEQYGDAPLVIGGDSAGGNLTAVCAQRARDRGGPSLALQVLVYPVTDLAEERPSYFEHGSGPKTFLTAEEMAYFHGHYITDPSQLTDPEVSPLRAETLAGLPPAIVVTAGYDPLRDDGFAYAERLTSDGVPVIHHHYGDTVHAFFTIVTLLARGEEAIAQVAEDIRTQIAAVSTA